MRKKQKVVLENGDGNFQITLNKRKPEMRQTIPSVEKQRLYKRNKKPQASQEIQNIKIKTLEEIRAERNAKLAQINEEKDEGEVSSTSKEEGPLREPMQVDVPQHVSTSPSSNPIGRKLRLRRKLPVSENVMSSSTSSRTDSQNPRINSDSRMNSMNTRDNNDNKNSKKNTDSANDEKMLDDVLLLEEDDDEYDINLKTEEDLLNDLDDD